jgi:enoyl-CoA hydratase/carnithine racemase
VTLNRPDHYNALDSRIVDELVSRRSIRSRSG